MWEYYSTRRNILGEYKLLTNSQVLTNIATYLGRKRIENLLIHKIIGRL